MTMATATESRRIGRSYQFPQEKKRGDGSWGDQGGLIVPQTKGGVVGGSLHQGHRVTVQAGNQQRILSANIIRRLKQKEYRRNQTPAAAGDPRPLVIPVPDLLPDIDLHLIKEKETQHQGACHPFLNHHEQCRKCRDSTEDSETESYFFGDDSNAPTTLKPQVNQEF